MCLLFSIEAHAQAGVLVRGPAGDVQCVPGTEHTSFEVGCADVTCEPGRVCVELADVGARCIDPSHEIVCVPGEGGCDVCPMNLTTGADPEVCRVITLPDGPHSICIYSVGLVCLGDDSFGFDALLCLPSVVDDPSIAAGDCDGDGVPNSEDTCLCERGTGPSCALVPVDAGTLDAGGVDAGPSLLDAATRDGSTTPIIPVFRGGGGCACGAARRVVASELGAVMLLLVALGSRRRRARPHESQARTFS